MANAIVLNVSLATAQAADADGIAQSQTPLAGGNLTLNGALAGILATVGGAFGRQVLITCAGADAGRTFTLYGTSPNGTSITEAMAGSNASTSTSVKMFQTVTRVAVDAATAGAVEVGTNGLGATRWVCLDTFADPFSVGIAVDIAGTINFTQQITYDDPNSVTNPTTFDVSDLASKTADTQAALSTPVKATRLKINSFTATATATETIIQAGV